MSLLPVFPDSQGYHWLPVSMGNDQHVVADGTDFGQNMGTEDNGVFLFQAFDQITDLVDLFRIKPTVGSSRMITSG